SSTPCRQFPPYGRSRGKRFPARPPGSGGQIRPDLVGSTGAVNRRVPADTATYPAARAVVQHAQTAGSAVTCPGAAGPGRAGPGGRPAQRGCAPRPAPLPARAGASGGWPVACGSVTGGQRSCVLSEGRRTVAADQAKEAAMPDDPHHPLSAAAAEAFISRTCFKTGPPRLVGVELEWLLHDPSDL